MKTHCKNLIKIAPMLLGLAFAIVLFTSCSLLESPTVSQTTDESDMGLWNPVPGTQIVPGREVPLVNPNYWDTQNGYEVNPARMVSNPVRVGVEGGTVQIGLHTLIVPPRALSSDAMITMSMASTTAIAVDCTPSGLTFNVPATLILSFAGTQYQDRENGRNLEIYYMPTSGELVPEPSTVDMNSSTVRTQLNHFSRYIIG